MPLCPASPCALWHAHHSLSVQQSSNTPGSQQNQSVLPSLGQGRKTARLNGLGPVYLRSVHLRVQPTHSSVQPCHCTGGSQGLGVTRSTCQTWRRVNRAQSHLSSPPPHRQSYHDYQGAGLSAGSILTRGRRGGCNKSESAHSWGILRDQLLAIRAYLALFVLEQTRETSVREAQAYFSPLADGKMHRNMLAMFPLLGAVLELRGWHTPLWRKRGRTSAPAKTLRTCQSRH